jgi:predicted enzyme related to lactoylglutathione lyase
MNHPIQNRIGAVFIPVSDMARAVAWYSQLLGLPVATTSHEGAIYDVPMADDVALILDANKPVTNSSQPLIFFWTEDIRAAYDFLKAHAVTLVREVEDIGSVSTLTFQDPDGNLLMVCQRNGVER